MSHFTYLKPSFCRNKIGLSLSHLVPEILGPKVSLIFHLNVFFLQIFSILCQFTLNFRSNWPPFSLILNLFDPSFSQNLRSDWVQIFFTCWTRVPNIWWSTPSPRYKAYCSSHHRVSINNIYPVLPGNGLWIQRQKDLKGTINGRSIPFIPPPPNPFMQLSMRELVYYLMMLTEDGRRNMVTS